LPVLDQFRQALVFVRAQAALRLKSFQLTKHCLQVGQLAGDSAVAIQATGGAIRHGRSQPPAAAEALGHGWGVAALGVAEEGTKNGRRYQPEGVADQRPQAEEEQE
jgi:hypothetical protein